MRQLSVEEVAISLLDDALRTDYSGPSPEEVVARIQALPGNPQNVRPASGSLGEALRVAPGDPDFDLTTWQQDWAVVEAEMKIITRANDVNEYHKWVEWSDEDQTYIGKCPDLITGIYGDDPVKLYGELCDVVEDVIEHFAAENRSLPRARIRPMQEVA